MELELELARSLVEEALRLYLGERAKEWPRLREAMVQSLVDWGGPFASEEVRNSVLEYALLGYLEDGETDSDMHDARQAACTFENEVGNLLRGLPGYPREE